MDLKHSDLNTLFTAIADAIREKNNATTKIIADNFPDEILALETDTLNLDVEISEQENLIAQIQAALQNKFGE